MHPWGTQYMQNAHMPVEIFMYMNLNPHAARIVLIIKPQSIYPNHSPGVLGILCGKFTLTCVLLLRSAGKTKRTKNAMTTSGRGGWDHACSLQINRQRMQPCTLKATDTGSWVKSVCD